MSSVFEDAAFESTVFVEAERTPALEVLFSLNKMCGDAQSTVFVVSESPRRQKYYFR